MKAVLLLSLFVVIIKAKAWSSVRNPFEFSTPPKNMHTITDCMFVTSEEGDFFYEKMPHLIPILHPGMNAIEEVQPSLTVCGLYVVTDPDKVVEISVQYLDVHCESGGLLAFVDGWELNGQYFPSIKDHQLNIEQRVTEFCNMDKGHWPKSQNTYRKVYRSSQNAALMQYRIPVHGSFVLNVKLISNPTPCNIMTEGISPYYTLKNFKLRSNCTLTALFPAVVTVVGINIGGSYIHGVNYDCTKSNNEDKLEIGGSNGLDSFNMEKTSSVCGQTDSIGPEQAIFCGVTSVRLLSSGKYSNEAVISIRAADESDINLATLVCEV